ncbi:MAG: GHMP kinase [bacterium]|nr:MAG: GHMP kinase [bacterium]
MEQLTVSAPGRICLFGEHQDYLGLPVITAAINLRISITGSIRNDRKFYLDLPDIGSQEEIDLEEPIVYIKERDYFRSGLKVLLRQKVIFPYGYDCIVRGNIPINSGTSSSSALVIAWIKFLLTIAADKRQHDPLAIARLAHQAEVLEFNEPGGMMDHFAASFGSILYIDFRIPGGRQLPLPAKLGHFVLGDSQQPKDTKAILTRVKDGTLKAMGVLYKENERLKIQTLSLEELEYYKGLLSQEQYELLKGNIINRELTQQAKELLQRGKIDRQQFGDLLNAHQNELRDRLCISTSKIDRMNEAALKAGAVGAKINGSGGGGCMFAYAPKNYEQVAEAITHAGGKSYIIKVDKGVKIIKYCWDSSNDFQRLL